MKKSKAVIISCLVGILVLSLVACAQPAAPKALPAEIDIATYAVGTVAYVVTTGWAEIVGKYTPMRVVVKPMAAPPVYMPRVNAGEVLIGIDTPPSASRAYTGTGEFQGKKLPNLLKLWQVYTIRESTPFAVKKDSKYNRIEDLKGARVASGYGGALNYEYYLAAAFAGVGMTWNDVVRVPVADLTAGVQALRDGRVDATFGHGEGAPVSQEVHAAIGMRYIGYPRNPEEIPEYKRLLPGFGGVLLKPGPIGIIDREVWGIANPFWYIATKDLSDEAAYQLVKVAYERDTEIQPVLSTVREWTRKEMLGDFTVPMHPGAIRLYKEKGVWTAEREKRQKELLGQ